MSRIPPAPTGAPETAALDGVQAAAEPAAAAAPAPIVAPAQADAVRAIAEDLAAGRISRGEAIDRIIGEALGADVVRAAPAQLRAEIAEALASLVETDPYLQSLVRGLGAPPEEGR